MKTIDFDIWEPVPGKPGQVQRTGQRAAQEVFAELKHRLESTGLLPDEYFLMDDHWRDGREIPKDAGLFCTADYGDSEGIYLDVYLKWHEDGKSITKSFITGKTLDESGVALDRMHLVASAIMKAVHGDHASHARYVKLGAPDVDTSIILHLNPAEHQRVIDSLILQRETLKEDFILTEQLLRRATGGILQFVDEVGQHPMKIDAYDHSVLAIHDGDIDAFNIWWPQAPSDRHGDLLIHAAGRPGTVGKQMTIQLLLDHTGIPNEQYLTACKQAVDTGNINRALLITQEATYCVQDLDMGLYGEVIRHAYVERQRHIATALIEQCSPEQIAAAHPGLLYIAAMNGDFKTCFALAEKGIVPGEYESKIQHTLENNNNGWIWENMVSHHGLRLESPEPQHATEQQME